MELRIMMVDRCLVCRFSAYLKLWLMSGMLARALKAGLRDQAWRTMMFKVSSLREIFPAAMMTGIRSSSRYFSKYRVGWPGVSCRIRLRAS